MLFACCCRWTVKQKRKQNREEDFLLFRIASSTGCSTQRPGRPPPHRSGNPLTLKYDPSQLSRSITERPTTTTTVWHYIPRLRVPDDTKKHASRSSRACLLNLGADSDWNHQLLANIAERICSSGKFAPHCSR